MDCDHVQSRSRSECAPPDVQAINALVKAQQEAQTALVRAQQMELQSVAREMAMIAAGIQPSLVQSAQIIELFQAQMRKGDTVSQFTEVWEIEYEV